MTNFQEKLKQLMDEYVHFVYNETRNFPREEKYSSVSQWRRSTLSIILNYIEGYARKKLLVQLNFFETAYGSFRESKYLLYFAYKRKFIAFIEFIHILDFVNKWYSLPCNQCNYAKNRIRTCKNCIIFLFSDSFP